MTVAFSESDHRLQHSPEGLRRLTQIESAEIHIYVEGKTGDRYYYSKVLDETIRAHGLKVEFHLAREIAGVGEGKQRCLRYHDFLQASGNLVSKLDGKCTVNCFFLDKDIDELQGLLKDSLHIVYTSDYCVENHIVTESVLTEALAAAAGVDIQTVRAEIPDPGLWLSECYALWKEWVAICIFAHISKSGITNYKRLSQVNVPIDGPAEQGLVEQYVRSVGVKLAIDAQASQRGYDEALQIVEDHASQGLQGKLFKGKWFVTLLAQVSTKLTGSADEKMLWTALCSHVRTDHPQSNRYRAYVLGISGLCA